MEKESRLRIRWRATSACRRSGRQPRLRLTGTPPANDAERLVESIVGKGKSAPLPWLEERLSGALYHAEVSRGAWAVDIGIWGGPELFKTEASRLIKELRPEFARLTGTDGNSLPGLDYSSKYRLREEI